MLALKFSNKKNYQEMINIVLPIGRLDCHRKNKKHYLPN